MNRLQQFSMLALLAVAAQGAWAQTALTLYDAADNRTTISTAADNGGTYNVTLSGRTLYCDGDWNTLCLPFDMTTEQIAASPLAGTTIKALDGTTSYLDANGKLTLKFDNTTTIAAGNPYIVKWPVVAINNASDWNTFLTSMSNNTSYKGKIVRLYTDIETNEMVPGSFTGIFDGNGHTIHCTITGGSNDQGTALFNRIYNATIMNLKVTGTVQGYNHCAGLVGLATVGGTNTIKNCEVNVNVTCSGTHCGGILGHGTTSTTTISDCLFSGNITGGTADVGIICGWSDTDATTTISNCLANGVYTTNGTYEIIKGNGTKAVNNCYLKNNESTADLVSSLGSNWEVSGNYVVPKMAAESNITDPVFNGVTIKNTTADVRFTGDIDTFKGNYAPLSINDNNRSDILLLTSGNQLGYVPTGYDMTLNSFRAYFHIPAYPSQPNNVRVRSFSLDFGDDEATGIISLSPDPSPKDKGNPYIYDLQGRRVTNPTRGLYIVNGRKVLINK